MFTDIPIDRESENLAVLNGLLSKVIDRPIGFSDPTKRYYDDPKIAELVIDLLCKGRGWSFRESEDGNSYVSEFSRNNEKSVKLASNRNRATCLAAQSILEKEG